MTTILIIKLNERELLSDKLQEIISSYGCYIQTRLGLHDVKTDSCSPVGIIILQLLDKKAIINDMMRELKSLDNIKIEKIMM